jgi:hypothetical protein
MLRHRGVLHLPYGEVGERPRTTPSVCFSIASQKKTPSIRMRTEDVIVRIPVGLSDQSGDSVVSSKVGGEYHPCATLSNLIFPSEIAD